MLFLRMVVVLTILIVDPVLERRRDRVGVVP
jgi:hypothetical protein